jgi:hypothetical protein
LALSILEVRCPDVQRSIALTGHPSPPPLLSMPNVDLHMLLDETFQRGTASYRFSRDNGTTWTHVENVNVEIITQAELQPA